MNIGFLSVANLLQNTEYGNQFTNYCNSEIENYGVSTLSEVIRLIREFSSKPELGSSINQLATEKGLDVILLAEDVICDEEVLAQTGKVVYIPTMVSPIKFWNRDLDLANELSTILLQG